MHTTPPDHTMLDARPGIETVYPRDASWWNNPSTSGPKYYHRMRDHDDDKSWAKCSDRIMLNFYGIPITLANGLLCARCFGARTIETDRDPEGLR